MPEKGFDLKVLIPTDDGLTISENGVQQALYFLLYNVSNRSYQLAGKIKTNELYRDMNFAVAVFYKLLMEEGIDLVFTLSSIDFEIPCENKVTDDNDIGINLNHLIDIIERKKS